VKNEDVGDPYVRIGRGRVNCGFLQVDASPSLGSDKTLD
jgi:hypothetical protein